MKHIKTKFAALLGFLSLGFTNASFAALSATDMTALETEVNADIDVVKPVALGIIFTVVALLVGIKVLKRLMGKV